MADVLEAGEEKAYPTYTWFGVTHVKVLNSGPEQTAVSFTAGAGHEMHWFDPGEQRTFPRQWAGIWVHVKNEGDQVGQHQLTITVW